MSENQDYHIYATSTLTDDRLRVLKHHDLFAVFDRHGEIRGHHRHDVHGLFHHDMRHLSHLELRLADQLPLLLSSTVKDDNALLTVDLTNPDLSAELQSDTLHVLRSKFVLDRRCHEQIQIHNYGSEQVTIPLELTFGADFIDVFELRGVPRK